MNELTTFIPAGGLGSRLHPHTLDTPKPLLPMGPDRTIIDHALELSGTAATHTFVSIDYLGDQIETYLETKPEVEILPDPHTAGNAGTLLYHKNVFEGLDPEGDTLVLPGDHIYQGLSLCDFWQAHREFESNVTALTVPAKPYGEYVGTMGRTVLDVHKEPRPDSLSTTGIFIVRNKYLVDWIYQAAHRTERQPAYSLYYDILCPAVPEGKVSHYSIGQDGYWEDTGTPSRYLASNMRVSGGKNVVGNNAQISPEANLSRCVVLSNTIIELALTVEDSIMSTDRHGILQITKVC